MSKSYMAYFNAGPRLYCGTCRKSTLNPEIEYETMTDSRDASKYAYYKYNYGSGNVFNSSYDVAKTYKCGHCGEVHGGSKEEIVALDSRGQNLKYRAAFVFDKDPDKVVLKICYNSIKAYGKFLKMKSLDMRIVTNVKTGYTYELMPYIDGKRPKKPAYVPIKNVTYYGNYIFNEDDIPEWIKTKYYNAILDKLKKMYGDDIKTLEVHNFENILRGYSDNTYSLARIHLYNRFPHMNPATTETLYNVSRNRYAKGKMDDRLARINRGNDNPAAEIMKNFKLNITDPKVIDNLISNPRYLYNYKLISNITSDHDKIIKWMYDIQLSGPFVFYDMINTKTEKNILKFVRYMQKRLGKQAAETMILSQNLNALVGVSEKYEELNRYGVTDIVFAPFDDLYSIGKRIKEQTDALRMSEVEYRAITFPVIPPKSAQVKAEPVEDIDIDFGVPFP